MTKYYRVRTQEQWDWLKNKLEIEDDLHVSDFPMTLLYGDVFCGIYKYHDDPEPLIEVSQMMEDEKMEDYVTIQGKDLLTIKDEKDRPVLNEYHNLDKGWDGYSLQGIGYIKYLKLPTASVYPKVPMTEAEKAELDKLKNEMSAHIYDLDDLLTRTKDSEDYPLLYHRLYVADGDGVERQLEFARAWADPSLIEVVPEKHWNVKVPPFERTNKYYYKDGRELRWAGRVGNDEEDQQFTADELKEYGLDDDMYEKVEVTDDGTK